LVSDRNTPQKVVWRARIVLLAGDGVGAVAISATVGVSVLTVRRWRRRYTQQMVVKNLVERTYAPPRLELTAQGHEVPAALFNRG